MSELNFTEDEFNNFIKVLTKDCELIINIDGSITTEIVRDNLREVNKQREAARKRKQRLQEGKNNNKENTLSRIFNMWNNNIIWANFYKVRANFSKVHPHETTKKERKK